jgi:hypothetical protein
MPTREMAMSRASIDDWTSGSTGSGAFMIWGTSYGMPAGVWRPGEGESVNVKVKINASWRARRALHETAPDTPQRR